MSVETNTQETAGPQAAHTPPVEERTPPPPASERLQKGEEIIRRNTLWAAGAGAFVVVWPYMDIVAATAAQVKMLKNLSDLYAVKFSEGLALKVVGTLVMATGGALIGDVTMRLLRFIPGVGTALGALSAPLMASAFAHALGRVYLIHLESGGTLLDFDPQAMQERFQSEFEKSKQQASRWLKKDKPEHATTVE